MDTTLGYRYGDSDMAKPKKIGYGYVEDTSVYIIHFYIFSSWFAHKSYQALSTYQPKVISYYSKRYSYI